MEINRLKIAKYHKFAQQSKFIPSEATNRTFRQFNPNLCELKYLIWLNKKNKTVKSNILKNLLPSIKTNLYKHKTLFKTIPIVLLLIIAAVIFFYRITAPSMWVDEMNARSQSSWSRAWCVQHERNMLSYGYLRTNYYFEKVFGNIDFSVRAPQAVSALLTLIFVFFLGKHIFSTGVGYISVILLMTNPFFVRYAQENRYYQMGSLCFLAYYSFLAFYISSGRRIFLVGIFLFVSMYLRCHEFGIVQVPILIIPALFLIFVSERKNISTKRIFVELALTGLITILFWTPNLYYIIKFRLQNSGAAPKRGVDAFYIKDCGYSVARFGKLLSALSQDIFGKFGNFFLIGVLILASIGSAIYSKWRAVALLIYLMIATLPVLYFMNGRHAVVMSKRILYLLPPITLLCVGGVWCAIKLISEPSNLLFNKLSKKYGKYLYYIIYTTITFIAVLFLLLPVLKSNMTRTCNNYFKDREMYKSAAKLISMNWLPGDKIVFTKQSDWVLSGYTPCNPNFWRLSTSFSKKQLLLDKYNKGNGIWSLHNSPEIIGLSSNEFIRIPFYRGSVYIARKLYKDNPKKKIQETKRLLRNAIIFSTMPEISSATKLIELYNKDKQLVYAKEVADHLASFDLSYGACSLSAKIFNLQGQKKRANEIWYNYANKRFWEGSSQKRAAKLAFKAKNYKLALKYNLRYKFISLGKNCLNNNDIGLSYYHLKNYKNALKYFDNDIKITLSNIVKNSNIIEPYLVCLKETGNQAEYIRVWLMVWQKNNDPSKLYPLYSLLDDLIKNKKRIKNVLKKLSEKCPETIPFVEFLKKTVLENDIENLHQNLLLFKKHAGGEIWPLYTYAVDRFAKKEWKDELKLPLSELVLKFKADQVAKTNMRIAKNGWASKENPCFVKAKPKQKNLFAEFDVNIALSGKYKLFVSLATTKKLPFDIYVNDKLTLKTVGGNITGSLATKHTKDIEVGSVELIKGTNKITIRIDNGSIQHITGISVIKL